MKRLRLFFLLVCKIENLHSKPPLGKMRLHAAGILFCDTKMVLLGRKKGLWTGFGGSLYPREEPSHGAVREILEEIYGLFHAEDMVQKVLSFIPLGTPLSYSKGYVLYTLPFSALEEMSQLIAFAPHFPQGEIPKTLPNFLRAFRPLPHSEIHRLQCFSFSALEKRTDIDLNLRLDLVSCAKWKVNK